MKSSVTSQPSAVIQDRGNRFFFITDRVYIFKTADHGIGSVCGFFTHKGYHHAGCAFKGGLHAVNSCGGSLLLVGGGKHGRRTALAYVKFYGAGFDAKAGTYQVFQIFSAAGQHFVPKGVCAHTVVILADKGALRIVDSFGDTDNDIAVFFKGRADLCKKLLRIKVCFREINKKRIVSLISAARAEAAVSQPA